jgi:hypothetical protein
MPIDAIVNLNQLNYLGPSAVPLEIDPYIWPALLRIDDDTLVTDFDVAIVTPSLQNAQVVIKERMRAGQTAVIPGSVGVLRTRFEDNLITRHLLLVVLLLEKNETPESAIEAGFQAFASELRAAVAKKFLLLDSAEKSGDEEGVKALKQDIVKSVDQAVTTAIENSLSSWEKVKVAARIMVMDHAFGSDFLKFGGDPLSPKAFTLNFEFKGRIEIRFQIQGQLQTRPVLVDVRCLPEVEAVKAAQSEVNGIEEEIKKLQAQLRGEGEEPPLPKEYIIGEIKRLRTEELASAEALLKSARLTLQECRIRKERSTSPGGGVAIG